MRNEQPQNAARQLGNNPNLGDFLRHDMATSPRWNRPSDDGITAQDTYPRVRSADMVS